MKIIKQLQWVIYFDDESKYISHNAGKWMYFFKDQNHAIKMCENAINNGIVEEAKHTNGLT